MNALSLASLTALSSSCHSNCFLAPFLVDICVNHTCLFFCVSRNYLKLFGFLLKFLQNKFKMGRMNRSRKRRDEMNKIKKARNAAKDLIRLKKTLGLLDADGNEIMKDAEDVATVKTAKELKQEKIRKEYQEIEHEFEEEREKGEEIEVVNEKTGKKHTYNTKTMKDQHGSYPPWYKPKKTAKRIRKLEHARKKRFRQAWTTINIPL